MTIGGVLIWISLCNLCVLCVSVVIGIGDTTTTEDTELSQRRIQTKTTTIGLMLMGDAGEIMSRLMRERQLQ
jgi:hypothetical protein